MKIEDFFMVIEDYQSWLKEKEGIEDLTCETLGIEEIYEKHRVHVADYFFDRYVKYLDNEIIKVEKLMGKKIKW